MFPLRFFGPPRVKLNKLSEDYEFEDYDKCQAEIVYMQMKYGGRIIKDPTTTRIVWISPVEDSDWAKESHFMCSHGADYRNGRKM
jgi:hypothetical protein